jgi:hypothetical protein
MKWRTATAVAVALLAWPTARAQTLDAERPATWVTGRPAGGARFDRVDASRSGLTSTLLPASGLRTAWHASLGVAIEQAPVVDAQETTYVVGVRGEVIALGPQGEERWRASSGSTDPGPLALLSDDSVVFVDAAGEAVAVRQGAVRWRAHFGRGGTFRPAPLPLDDGGVVVATSHELAVLDAEGGVRSRVVLSEPMATPLLSAGGRIIVVGASGAVWEWVPGAADATRVSTFGSAVDGTAVLTGTRGQMLLAVTGRQARLATIDLEKRASAAVARAVAPGGRWLGPPAVEGNMFFLQLLTPTGELAVVVDSSGTELARTVIALRPGPSPANGLPSPTAASSASASGASVAAADASAAAISMPPHTAPIVDANGTLAFATSDGALGVVAGLAAGTPVVEVVVDACPPALSASSTGRASGGVDAAVVAGLAPLGRGGFVAACASGTVLAVRGARSAEGRSSLRTPAPRAPAHL